MSEQMQDFDPLAFIMERLMYGDPHQINTYAIQGGKVLIGSPYITGLIEISARVIED